MVASRMYSEGTLQTVEVASALCAENNHLRELNDPRAKICMKNPESVEYAYMHENMKGIERTALVISHLPFEHIPTVGNVHRRWARG